MGYMSELLSLKPPPAADKTADPGAMPSAPGMHAKLVKADMHGAFITGAPAISLSYIYIPAYAEPSFSVVKESKNAALVGIAGIVAHESEGTFRIVTKKNAMKRPF